MLSFDSNFIAFGWLYRKNSVNNKITQEYLKSILRYDSEIGQFFWIVARGQATIGKKAAYLMSNGYRYIGIDKKRFLEHRLAWLYVHGEMPEDQIDHVNHIRDDNRIENLRAVSRRENQQNRPIQKNNTSGITGASWCKRDSKWQTFIKANGKLKHLGYFNDYFEACCIRKSADLHFGYHENHGRNK